MKRSILLVLLTILISSCASHKKVLYTMENRDKPEWATLTKTVWEEKGYIKAIGYTEGTTKSNISALAQIADNNGKSEIVRLLSNQVGVVVENLHHGDSLDNSNYKFFGSEETLQSVRNLVSKERYYEYIAIDNGTDFPDKKIEFYSLVVIKKSDFKKAITEALWKKYDNKEELNKTIDDKLNNLIGAQ